MKIGDLARLTGTRVETIRFYEKEGLISSQRRTSGNYRIYQQEHLNRLSFIRRSRDLGFTLGQVRTLLDLADDNSRSCAAVDEITRDQLQFVEQKIQDLNALKYELSNLLNQCRQGTIADCRIIDALAPSRKCDRTIGMIEPATKAIQASRRR
ncbi:putative MerR family transcriptional regulator [Caenibius tardaugens NBRC 16725]|uniref:Putative MerR family transcriptional regulator n=1 Tax=Caenibius tardaugens NBRC 16725 TaxID=1219035 RepID=U2YK09_9SPHN|nr:helix-turn-helix domain-containing protein [Caenibius tardaugens]AZI36105.1 MerR family transcriptional regulator [Caenibius tardaugens NBRC 16725]GAD48815.1 putative MerR family transcriptional regulator [Caenibius tardaugens NBRC 16725]